MIRLLMEMKNVWIVLLLLVTSALSACRMAPTQPSAFVDSLPQASATSVITPFVEFSDNHLTSIEEIEKRAGFHIKEPTYLPEGVLFDFADYQQEPSPRAILHFKIIHKEYGDMGAFFQIMQSVQAEAPTFTISCGEIKERCEMLQIGGMPVIYRWNEGGTEALDWYTDGYSLSLLRTAGEPGKIYKEELLKIVTGLK